MKKRTHLPSCFTPRDRFMLRVRAGVLGDCWPFDGANAGRSEQTYRKFDGEYAHRYMWQLVHRRPPPRGKVVRHTCDNPSCVNPTHLVLGTYKQNAQDCNNRGRRVHGERHPSARLTEAQVRSVRRRWKQGVRQVDLAQEYGISQAAISLICCGRNWRRVK